MATIVLPETTRALYPFKSYFLILSDGQRMHYVDEGPPEGEVLVFLHGYPMWSFLYRALLINYAAQGYRCIAPDHIGYGLSDKPTSKRYHTLRRHIHNLMECLIALELHDITLVMEDWGGPLGLGFAIRHSERIKRLVIMNSWGFQDTYTNQLHPLVQWFTKPGIGEVMFKTLNLAFSLGVQRWTTRQLSPAVLMAYKVPFRDARNRTALVQFPRMISTSPTHSSAASMREIEEGLITLKHIPSLILWGTENPIFSPGVAHHWKKMMPRAKGPFFIKSARHFLTEDAPDSLTQHLDTFLERTYIKRRKST